mmetsp:Transcript_19784/g.43250  ORF Transcript_19784/g.43250 Transcript_19784/m.43250 type:complete len:284 (+) Transcript_19784:244-1095(+)
MEYLGAVLGELEAHLKDRQGVGGEHQQSAGDGVGAGRETGDTDQDTAALGVQALAASAAGGAPAGLGSEVDEQLDSLANLDAPDSGNDLGIELKVDLAAALLNEAREGVGANLGPEQRRKRQAHEIGGGSLQGRHVEGQGIEVDGNLAVDIHGSHLANATATLGVVGEVGVERHAERALLLGVDLDRGAVLDKVGHVEKEAAAGAGLSDLLGGVLAHSLQRGDSELGAVHGGLAERSGSPVGGRGLHRHLLGGAGSHRVLDKHGSHVCGLRGGAVCGSGWLLE